MRGREGVREGREGEEGRYTDHLCTQDAALPQGCRRQVRGRQGGKV